MWRREKRLKYWLEDKGQFHKDGVAGGLVKKLPLIFRVSSGTSSIGEESLSLDAATVSLDEALATTATVKDGLGALLNWTCNAIDQASAYEGANNLIHGAALLVRGRTFDLQLPNERLASIREAKLEIAPGCRKLSLSMPGAEVFELENGYCLPPELRNGHRFLVAAPSVHTLASKMAELPHSRKSVGIGELSESEYLGFLREAEVLKGVPAERGKVLAVFRKVPIEIISRLRYLEDKKAIFYSISRELQLTKTRVHDMCAVLDSQTMEIHLVPHRTRFQSVSLN